jgi:hypothetical protein
MLPRFRQILVATMRLLARWHSIDGRLLRPAHESHAEAAVVRLSRAQPVHGPGLPRFRDKLVIPAELDEAGYFANDGPHPGYIGNHRRRHARACSGVVLWRAIQGQSRS